MASNRIDYHSASEWVLLTVAFAAAWLLVANPIEAQLLSWESVYGGVYNETGNATRQTADGGYVALGSTFSFGAGDYDLYLLRITPFGDTLWSRTYGGDKSDFGYGIALTNDGGFVLVGMTTSFGAGKGDVYLVRVDSLGNVLWEKTYGGAARDEARAVVASTDGGFVVTGTTASSGAGYDDVYLLKVGAGGALQWSRTYGGAGGETGAAICRTPDGGYAVVGSTGSFGTGYSSIYFIRTNASGDSLWTALYGGTGADFAYALKPTSDGGFAIAGSTTSFGAGYGDMYLVKTDSTGWVQWQNTFGGTRDDRGYTIEQAADGSYLVGGTTESFGGGQVDVLITSVDSLGNELWTRAYGGAKSDFCRALVLENFACVMVGQTYSYSSGGSDLYLLKIATDQTTPVEETSEQSAPDEFVLEQNYPNPFNLETTIEFTFPQRTPARLTVFNSLGQLVRSWHLNAHPGTNRIVWDARTDGRQVVASGVYFYRLEAAHYVQTRKLVLLK